MIRPHRRSPLWLAFILHRVSGVLLALFLPAHFYVLSLALSEPARLDVFLHWAELPVVRAAEFVLLFLLAVHLFGGLRLMAIEFLPWSPRQKTYVALGVVARTVSVVYLFVASGLTRAGTPRH